MKQLEEVLLQEGLMSHLIIGIRGYVATHYNSIEGPGSTARQKCR